MSSFRSLSGWPIILPQLLIDFVVYLINPFLLRCAVIFSRSCFAFRDQVLCASSRMLVYYTSHFLLCQQLFLKKFFAPFYRCFHTISAFCFFSSKISQKIFWEIFWFFQLINSRFRNTQKVIDAFFNQWHYVSKQKSSKKILTAFHYIISFTIIY